MQPHEAMLRGLLGREVLRDVGAELEARGVRWVALKGAALHALGLREAGDRPIEDVDVLVEERRLPDVIEAGRALGFEAGVRDAVTVTLIRPSTPLPLDVHYRLFEPGLFRLEAQEVLGRAVQGGGVRVPAPLDLYGHLVGHFAKGRLGARDRGHLEDLGAVARGLGLRATDVAAHLERHGLGRAARYVLSLARDVVADDFAREVLATLPPDRTGDGVAFVATLLLQETPPSVVGSLLASAMNDTLPRGAASFVRHGLAAAARSLRR